MFRLLVLTGLFAASGGGASAWPATPEGRQAVKAAMLKFENALDRQDSATRALAGWCAHHRLASPAVIRAERMPGTGGPANAEVRRELAAGPDEPVLHRRVRLMCGGRALSEADNWYRPRQLTAAMNGRLETTDAPFGLVVAPLGFHRRTLGVDWLFDPLAGEVGKANDGSLVLPHAILRHRALLSTAFGTPFSLVEETYASDVLAFGEDHAFLAARQRGSPSQ